MDSMSPVERKEVKQKSLKALESLGSPKFARLVRYKDDLVARPSFKSAFDEVRVAITQEVRCDWTGG